ncbi:MAG: caspase family protein [Blastocatellia bacterium]|nr:caspase family protein [Blastocatellia bacterium]
MSGKKQAFNVWRWPALAILLCLAGWSTSHPAILPLTVESAQAGQFELAVPELQLPAAPDPERLISSPDISQVEIHILNPLAQNIDYGQVSVRVNGEAAAGIYQLNASSRGKLVKLDLARLPGFRLAPGRNSIEVFVMREPRIVYSSFVLSTTASRLRDFQYETIPGNDPKQKTPPEIALLDPEAAIAFPTGRKSLTVTISGIATAASSIARVTVGGAPAALKRGAEVKTRSLGSANEERRASFTAPYVVTAGMTQIPVEAIDTEGNRTRLRIPVRSGSERPATEFRGRKFALMVGVSKFRNPSPGMGNLNYADKDAADLFEFLKTSGGGRFSPENMLLLTNEKATLANFRQALKEFVSRPGPDDLLVIFLATHGGPDPKAQQNRYFVLHDTMASALSSTGLLMEDLQDYLKGNVQAKRMLLFVDTCESAGLFGDPAVRQRGIVVNNLSNLYLEKLLYKEEGRAIITASDINESSLEGAKWGGGHGVFTHFLLEGMRGKADGNADRIVTVDELFRFVRERVRMETDFNQNPRLLVGENANLAIAAVTSQRSRRINHMPKSRGRVASEQKSVFHMSRNFEMERLNK